MMKRFVSLWFHHLQPDWYVIRDTALKRIAFVITTVVHGRQQIVSTSHLAEKAGIHAGMVLADARIILPSIHIIEHEPHLSENLLKKLANWCIRFTPVVSIDGSDALILDASGCTHLWGGDEAYLEALTRKLNERGYHIHSAMADTIGAAWAMARFGKSSTIVASCKQYEALLPLPPSALRISAELVATFSKLGLTEIKDILRIPRSALRRRFGTDFLCRLDQALGNETEFVESIQPSVPYHERLPSLEPIITLKGIEIALEQLLQNLKSRLEKEKKGVRKLRFICHRVDETIIELEIGTSRPTRNSAHLFKLFENKLSSIAPAFGIELFELFAIKVEDHSPVQERIWEKTGGLTDAHLAELLDKISGRFGHHSWKRYLPQQSYWPDRSMKIAESLDEQADTCWSAHQPRPVHLLPDPQPVEVTAPIPDYPPMLFRYRGQLHRIAKADGPERIEQEWWLQQGQHRDYYVVEDEQGNRFWIFRSGHYDANKTYGWFIHGFFA